MSPTDGAIAPPSEVLLIYPTFDTEAGRERPGGVMAPSPYFNKLDLLILIAVILVATDGRFQFNENETGFSGVNKVPFGEFVMEQVPLVDVLDAGVLVDGV